ncbi:MAG: glycosyltransferase [Sulfuricurvum sp.]
MRSILTIAIFSSLFGSAREYPPYSLSKHYFVLPSYREGLPRTSMEAASMGLPIVTTDVVGCRETVDDGVSGFLVPPKNSQALADAIEKLITNPLLRKKMGKAGREKAILEFDISTIITKHIDVYGLCNVH